MKVIATIPARLNSKRLPNKLLMKISGKPILQHTLLAAARAKKINEIWVCTTTNPEDAKIIELCTTLYDIHIHCGDPDDIISRILIVANQTKADYIVNVDGEQPLTDPRLIDKCVEILELGYQFVGFRGMPLGLTPIGFSREWLKATFATKDTKTDQEWWKLFESEDTYSVDTQKDYERIKEIMEMGYEYGTY